MPPVFAGLTAEELRKVSEDPSILNLKVIAGHTQAVERAIQTVTLVSEHVMSDQRRE